MINSMAFGRAFWLDDDNQFCSAPLRKDGEVDFDLWDYVSEWTDLEGVNLNSLLDIHRRVILQKHNNCMEEENEDYNPELDAASYT